MKKILITGASGFIGSFLAEEALKNGYKVYAGVRATSSYEYLKNLDVEYVELDFSDKDSLKEKLLKQVQSTGKFDFIIHNAGVTKSLNKRDFDKINFQFTKNFIEALLETDSVPEKFVYMSSLAAYGPGNEETMEAVRESDTPNPVTLYGISKLKAEKYITSLPDFPYLIFRPTGVYGPREKDYFVMYKMINQHIETYIGSSDQRLTFVYVKDLVGIIMKAVASDIERRSYFVTDGKQYSTLEFSEIVKSILNKITIRLVFPKALVKPIAFCVEKISGISGKVPTLNTEKYKEISHRNYLCDSEALVADFGYAPEYDLTRGLRETIAWCKQEKLL